MKEERGGTSTEVPDLETQETESPASSFGAGQNVSYLLIAWFPAFVALVLIPFAVYLPNQEEFGGNLFGPTVGVIAALLSFLLLLPILLLRPSVRARTSVLLFFFGLYLVLADILAPIQIGALTSGPSQITPWAPPFFTVVELVLLAVCLWAGVRIPAKWATKIGVPFVIVLVISQALYFSTNIGPNSIVKWGGHTFYQKKTRPFTIEKPATTGNVYQLCFDAYSSLVFLDAVKVLDASDAFEGFTFFKNNRSNYALTCASLPSYFTGTFFPGGSVTNWDRGRTGSGMIKTLHDNGYFVSMYTPDAGYFHDSGSHNRQVMDLIKDNRKPDWFFDPLDFADLCLLRIAPNWLQEELYVGGRGLLSRLFASPSRDGDTTRPEETPSEPDRADFGLLAEALLGDEGSRPPRGQYVYAHFLIAHQPIGGRNADCSRNRAYNSVYFDHAVCATRMMVRFIEELKDLGRFDDSTIIIHSDHGYRDVGDPNEERLPSHVASRIAEMSAFEPNTMINRTHALLLVKLPGQTFAPLRISERPTMLADLPATVYDALGINKATEQGTPVFKIGESQNREIHMFAGFYRHGVGGELNKMTYNRKGELCHFSFTRGKGWELYPDIPFTRD